MSPTFLLKSSTQRGQKIWPKAQPGLEARARSNLTISKPEPSLQSTTLKEGLFMNTLDNVWACLTCLIKGQLGVNFVLFSVAS